MISSVKLRYMTDSNFTDSSGRPRAVDTIIWGGLVAGILDATDGVIAFGLNGMSPIQVLQYIASGLLGPNSFKVDLQPRHWVPCFISSSRSLPPVSTTRHVSSCLLCTAKQRLGGLHSVWSSTSS